MLGSKRTLSLFQRLIIRTSISKNKIIHAKVYWKHSVLAYGNCPFIHVTITELLFRWFSNLEDELALEEEAERKFGWLLKLMFIGTATYVGFQFFPYMGTSQF